MDKNHLFNPRRQGYDFGELVLWALSTDCDLRHVLEVEPLSEHKLEGLLEFAGRNRVAPIVSHALQDAVGSQALSREWRSSHNENARRMTTLLGVLDEVAGRLQENGIAVVALKNAGIARGVYHCPACCPMGDIDILVERSEFMRAHEIVLGEGFQFSSRSSVEDANLTHAFESGGGTEYLKRVNGIDVWLELQWRPIAGRWIRRDQEPNGAEMIARSVPIPGTAVRILAPVDNMIQVALHTAKHSFVRAPGLRLHTDVDRLARFFTPDWHEVVAKAQELSIVTPVFVSLAIPKALFGSPIPGWVLESLAPPRWKIHAISHWIRRAGLFEPDQKKFSRPGMLCFHALLYDDLKGFLASVADTDLDSIEIGDIPHLLKKGVRRVIDVSTRYQR